MKRILIGLVTGTILGVLVSMYFNLEESEINSAIFSPPTFLGLGTGVVSGLIYNSSLKNIIKLLLSITVGALIFLIWGYVSHNKEFQLELLIIGAAVGIVIGIILGFVKTA